MIQKRLLIESSQFIQEIKNEYQYRLLRPELDTLPLVLDQLAIED